MSLVGRIFIGVFCIPLLLQGKILEVQNFKEVTAHISKDTWILIDIDDTLIVPSQMMGSDAWFQYRRRSYEKVGLTPNDALEKALAEWNAVRHLTKMEVVEPGTQAIIHKMQEDGYVVMGLTTQGLALATRTSIQLKDLGFNLEKTAPSKEGHYLNVHEHGALYRQGILFTSGTPKGEAIFALCEKIGCYPKEILFINDKLIQLVDVEGEARKRGVNYIGLRYAYSDFRKKAFNPEIADYQFENSTFGHILSDRDGFKKI